VGNVAATAALLCLPLSFVCFVVFRALQLRPLGSDLEERVMVTLLIAAQVLCLAAPILAAVALLLGTEHRMRAIAGIVGFLPALFLGYVVLSITL
jgi:hypothetical protein